MDSFNNITENPLVRELNHRDRLLLKERFSTICDCSHHNFLLLRKYINKIPYCFYSKEIYSKFSAWLNKRDQVDRSYLQNYLSANTPELNQAFLYLDEISKYSFHDNPIKIGDLETIKFFDKELHPSYLKLTEAVYSPFCKLIAHFLRKDRNKATDDLSDLWPAVQEITKSSISEITAPYNHLVRNAIAHGGITYLQFNIRYKDKKGNEEEYDYTEILSSFDDLVDICNSLALSLSIFLLANQINGYSLLQQVLLEELAEESRTPWWEITGCAPSEFSKLTQLIIFVKPNTNDMRKIQLSLFQSGILAERFAPGYDRYFFSIITKHFPGCASFNGARLKELRISNNCNINDYISALNDKLIFYKPRIKLPDILHAIYSLYLSLKIHFLLLVDELCKKRGQPRIIVRESKIHRNSWGCVMNSTIYINTDYEQITKETIVTNIKRIVKASLSTARKETSSLKLARYLPLGFAMISVYQENKRRRQLFGLGKDLVCTIQIKHIKRISCPDIWESTIEIVNNYRIAWNKEWLKSKNKD